MSDAGDVEVEVPQQNNNQILPKDVTAEIGSIKLFNKWSYEDVEIRDISLTYVDPIPVRRDTVGEKYRKKSKGTTRQKEADSRKDAISEHEEEVLEPSKKFKD